MDYQAFVEGDKTLLIAPAGFGKTYTIVESLKHTTGRQLILTHTHAGVAAIKEKIKNSSITSNQYSVETISSFAQKYVTAFYVGTDVPDQENTKDYRLAIAKRQISDIENAKGINIPSEVKSLKIRTISSKNE